MVSAVSKHLGQGIYTPGEAALYARERTQTVTGWLWGTKGRQSVIESQFDPAERIVSFLDFVQLVAIGSIRRNYGVPLQTIRRGVEQAKQHGVTYPFARRHKTFLLQRVEPGAAVDMHVDDEDDDVDDEDRERLFDIVIADEHESLVQMTGRHRGNRMIREITELYLTDLHFDSAGLAEQFDAFTYDNMKVTMNPKLHFGEPLTPSRYTAQTLWEAVLAEGNIELAAKAYGVEQKEVELACKYFDYLHVRPPRGKA